MRRVRHGAFFIAAFCCSGCLRLDGFLFNPTTATPDANLLARATAVPKHLQSEISDIFTAEKTPVNAYLLRHDLVDGTPSSRHDIGIVYCHGNSENIDLYALRAQALWQMGYTVLLFDYRGYGKTPGTPSEAGAYADARAARQHLTARVDLGMRRERIALYGYSLGAAVCAELAAEDPAPALILESPFSAATDLMQDSADLPLPPAWLLDARLDTRGALRRHRGHLLLAHGTNDTFITSRYSRELAAAAQPTARLVDLWLVKDADHNTVPCTHVKARSTTRGGCSGGFSTMYQERVTSLVDAAVGK